MWQHISVDVLALNEDITKVIPDAETPYFLQLRSQMSTRQTFHASRDKINPHCSYAGDNYKYCFSLCPAVYFARNRVIGQSRLIVHAITSNAPQTQTVWAHKSTFMLTLVIVTTLINFLSFKSLGCKAPSFICKIVHLGARGYSSHHQ